MALKLGIQTYQILTNDDEVCIPSLSSILIAVKRYVPYFCFPFLVPLVHICSDSISPSFLRFVASKLAQWVKIIYEEALIFLLTG